MDEDFDDTSEEDEEEEGEEEPSDREEQPNAEYSGLYALQSALISSGDMDPATQGLFHKTLASCKDRPQLTSKQLHDPVNRQ